MEWILIDENRLKITLSESDMRRYALSDGAAEGEGVSRASLRRLLEDTRARVGFETEGERLLLRLFSSRDGGGELFVTRLPREDGPPADGETLARGEAALLRCLREDGAGCLLLCEVLEDLLGVCRRLGAVGFEGESRVYIEEADGETLWYLALTGEGLSSGRLPLPLAFLSEYGSLLPAEGLLPRLEEYGRRVCAENAVSVLGEL